MNKKQLLLVSVICIGFTPIFASDPDTTPPWSSPTTQEGFPHVALEDITPPMTPEGEEGFPYVAPDITPPMTPEGEKGFPHVAPSTKRPASPSPGSPTSKKPKFAVQTEHSESGSPTKTATVYSSSPTEQDIRRPFTVGIYQKQNIKPKKGPQQDRYQTLTGEIGHIPFQLYGVFDGHGKFGGEIVSQRVSQKLLHYIADNITRVAQSAPLSTVDIESINTAIKNAFAQIDNEITQDFEKGGTTAVVAFVYGNKIIIANTGDSRAVVANYPTRRTGSTLTAELLLSTVDHKPGPPDAPAGPEGINEYTRLRALAIEPKMEGKTWRIGSLAVSRSIGDAQNKPNGEIARPEIYELTVTPDMENPFIILACDGIWDVIENQDAANLVALSLARNRNDGTLAASQLAERSRARGSTDDLTTIVIPIHPVGFAQSLRPGRAPVD